MADKYAQLNKIVAKLRGVMRSGAGLVAMCPAHDDKRQSLSLSVNDDGDVLLKCHAGCETADVVKAIDMTMADLFADGGERAPVPIIGSSRPAAEAIETIYPYRDPETGEVLNEVVRLTPKGFRQRRPDGNGGYVYTLGDVKRVLYRLWDVRQQKTKKAKKAVVFVEGEKDVDALWALKPPLPAVTNLGGASAWRPEYVEQLKAAGVERVMVIPDNDAPGKKHAAVIAEACHVGGLMVRVVELSGLPEKGDVSDYLAAGHSRGDLIREVLAAPAYKVSAAPAHEPAVPEPTTAPADDDIALEWVRLSEVEEKDVEWLWPGRFPIGMLTLLAGDSGTGKSFLSEDMAARLSRQVNWPDGRKNEFLCPTIFLAAEDPLSEVTRPRAVAMGADIDKIIVIKATRDRRTSRRRMFDLGADLEELRKLVVKTGAKLVVIDPVNAYLGGGKVDNYKDPEVRSILEPLAIFADELRVAVIGIMHLSKAAQAQVLYRIGGSVAFAAVARAVFFVSRDKDDAERRLFTNPKMSVDKEADSRAFRIAKGEHTRGAMIVWETDPVDISAAEAMKEESPQAKHTKKAEATEWLLDFLKDGKKSHRDVLAAGSEMGYSKSTLDRAKKAAKVTSLDERDERGQVLGHFWYLPKTKAPAK